MENGMNDSMNDDPKNDLTRKSGCWGRGNRNVNRCHVGLLKFHLNIKIDRKHTWIYIYIYIYTYIYIYIICMVRSIVKKGFKMKSAV